MFVEMFVENEMNISTFKVRLQDMSSNLIVLHDCKLHPQTWVISHPHFKSAAQLSLSPVCLHFPGIFIIIQIMFLVQIWIVIYKSLPVNMRWVLKFVHGSPFYYFCSVLARKNSKRC